MSPVPFYSLCFSTSSSLLILPNTTAVPTSEPHALTLALNISMVCLHPHLLQIFAWITMFSMRSSLTTYLKLCPIFLPSTVFHLLCLALFFSLSYILPFNILYNLLIYLLVSLPPYNRECKHPFGQGFLSVLFTAVFYQLEYFLVHSRCPVATTYMNHIIRILLWVTEEAELNKLILYSK